MGKQRCPGVVLQNQAPVRCSALPPARCLPSRPAVIVTSPPSLALAANAASIAGSISGRSPCSITPGLMLKAGKFMYPKETKKPPNVTERGPRPNRTQGGETIFLGARCNGGPRALSSHSAITRAPGTTGVNCLAGWARRRRGCGGSERASSPLRRAWQTDRRPGCRRPALATRRACTPHAPPCRRRRPRLAQCCDGVHSLRHPGTA
jgi:hypothetical protein